MGTAQVVWLAVKGKHTIKIVIDEGNSIVESNENNNVVSKEITVKSKNETSSQDSMPYIMVGVLAFIIVLILLLLLVRRRKKDEDGEKKAVIKSGKKGKSKKKPVIRPVKKPGGVPVKTTADESTKCQICLGAVKSGSPIVKCACNNIYHISCALRVGECPKCNEKFGNISKTK
jgi:LPXTG-motif cell wall-anchored protein